MGGIFGGGGGTITNEATMIKGLRVQSSTFGAPQSLIFGTPRVSGNLLDYMDFTAIAHTTTQTSGGKGGGGVTSSNTTYTYTVAAAIGLGAGPVTAIRKAFSDKDVKTLAELNLVAFTGTPDQAPWSYMLSQHPERALNYPYLCYVAGVIDLGESGTIPNWSFEVSGMNLFPGKLDANCYDIIKTLLTDKTIGANYPSEYIGDNSLYNAYCIANGLFISPAYTDQRQADEIINEIMKCSNSQPVVSQGKLYFKPYGTETVTGNGATYTPNLQPIFIIGDDDYIYKEGEDPVKLLRDDTVDRYNLQKVEFLNRDDNYSPDIATAPDQANIDRFGLRPASPVSLHCIADADVAQVVAQTILQRGLYYPNQYEFVLPYFPFFLLDPMDLIAINDSGLGLENTLVRVVSCDPDSNKEITFVVEEVGLTASSAALYPRQSATRTNINYNASPGKTNAPVIYEPPAEMTSSGFETWIAASGESSLWGGCTVWVSDNGDTYKRAGSIVNPARYGTLVNDISAGDNSITVQLNDTKTQLLSGTPEDAQNLRTICWLDGEAISYTTAALVSAGKYTLSGLVRGAYNTQVTAHSAGCSFVRCDDALYKYSYDKNMIGRTVYIKLTAFNIYGAAEQSLADVENVKECQHVISPQLPPNVSNIKLDENTFILKDGTALTDVLIDFSEPKYTVLDHYNVYYDENNSGVWTYSGTAQAGTGYRIKSLKQAQTVKVKVTTVNKYTLESLGAVSESYTVTGKSDPPPDVTGLILSQDEYNRANIILTWDALTQELVPDLKGYEARLGNVWETAKKINPDTIVGNSYTYTINANGSYNFLVKAIDNSGNYSKNPISKAIIAYVVPDAPADLIALQQDTDRSKLKISWTASPGKDISGYEIKINGTYIDSVKDTSYPYSLPASGTFNITVRAKNVAGYYSNASNTSKTVTIEPYDVTGFRAVQSVSDRTQVRLMWDEPITLDVAYFKIKKGPSWDSGELIAPRATGTFFDTIITTETEQTFWIKAVSTAGNEGQNAASVSGIFNMNPGEVRNIRITQNPNDKSEIIITWDGISESDLTGYQVAIGYVWDTAEKLPLTQELKTTYSPVSTGDLKVMIKAVNAAGYYSDEVSNHKYITLEPAAITGLMAYQNGETVELYWNSMNDLEPDITAYEIREGANFDQGSLIATGVTQAQFTVNVDSEHVYQYFVKAINRSGHYSQNAAAVSVSVVNLPVRNVIAEYDEIDLQNGTHNNTEFGQSLINWQTIGGKWSDYPSTKFSDVGGSTVLKLSSPSTLYDALTFGGPGWGARTKVTGLYGQNGARLTSQGFYKTGFTAGKTYTASAYFRVVDARPSDTLCVRREGTAGVTSYVDSSKVGIWQRVSITWTEQTGQTGALCFYSIATGGSYSPTLQPSWEITCIEIVESAILLPTSIYYSTGTYACSQIDVGQVITANITADFRSSVILRGTGSAVLQIRTSQDGLQWTDWTTFKPVQYTFRYAEFRVLLGTTDATKTPEVNHFTIRVDVPDTDIAKTETIAVGGATVEYGHTFYTIPVVTPIAVGENLHAQLLSKTKTNCVIKIKNASNTDVGGTVDLRIKGY